MPVKEPLLPQALDAEEALLGCILIDPEALIAVRPLKPADFYREAHRAIFATIRQLEADGLVVDVITLTTRLERTGQLERVGGAVYVSGLVNAAPTSLNAPYYADLVKKAAEGRQVIEMAGHLAAIGYHSTDPAQAAARAVEPLSRTDPDDAPLTPKEARARLTVLAPGLQRFDELMEQDFPPTLWIVPDFLPEGLTLLAAKPKLGKSWMALGLALAVASGGLALGKVRVEQGGVLYLALEDNPKRIRNRSQQLLRGAASPSALEVCTQWPRLDEGGLSIIKVWLQSRPDARLVIIDTLAKIRGRAKGNTLYGEDYASLEEVQALAHEYEIGVLVIHHTGKESREDALDEVNATQGLNGVADNILVLRRERGKAQATLIGDGRELNGVEQPLTFDTTTGAWTISEPAGEQAKTPERAEILDLLKASPQPMSPKQVAEALDKNVSTIRVLLSRMAHAGDIKMVSFGKYLAADNPINPVNDVNDVNASDAEDSSMLSENDQGTDSFQKKEELQERLLIIEKESKNESQAFTSFTSFTAVQDVQEDDGQDLPVNGTAVLMRLRDDSVGEFRLPPPPAPSPGTPGIVKFVAWAPERACTGVFCQGECACGDCLCDGCGCEAGATIDNHPWYYERHQPKREARCEFCADPATVASRWKTPMCERCWLIASRGQGINPRAFQPRPFGPIDGEDELGDEDAPNDAPAGASAPIAPPLRGDSVDTLAEAYRRFLVERFQRALTPEEIALVASKSHHCSAPAEHHLAWDHRPNAHALVCPLCCPALFRA